jgi:hypothetical protein
VAGTLAVRWPALDRKIWNLDEGSTITMAQQVLDGQVLFRDAVDNRTPLVPYLKALVLAVAGYWNADAIHIALALMIGFTAFLLWQTCRRLGHEDVGVFAALALFGLSTGLIPSIDAMAAHTGWFLIFFSALGFWCFAHALNRLSRVGALASGACFGLAMLAKQPGLLDFGVSVVIVLLLALGRERVAAWRLLPFMLAGFAVPLAVTLGYFAAHGALADLQFYAWTYNTKYYVPEVPLPERLAAVQVPLRLLAERMPAALVLGTATAGGLLWLVFVRERREPARAVLAWLTLGWAASGLLSTMLSGRDFAHYSIQVLPGVCLACGWGLAWCWAQARAAGNRGRRLVLQVLVLLAVASFIVPGAWSTATTEAKDDGTADIGAIVRQHSRSDERIFIWGYLPELHVFAQRLPSTRFFYTNWVTGLIPWTNVDWLKDTRYAVIPGTPEQLRQDYERRPPAVVVDTGTHRGYLKYPIREQAWLWEKVRREFAEVEPDRGRAWGCRVYRRIADAPYGAPFPAHVPVSAALSLELPASSPSEDTPITVRYPADTRAVELYKDGELYRRFEILSPLAGAVVFGALDIDLPLGERRFQALATGAGTIASRSATLQVTPPAPDPSGPPLEFNARTYTPIVATNLHGPMRRFPSGEFWDAQAPTRITYERPRGLHGLEFDYQMHDSLAREPGRWKTDGVDVVVRFENARGEVRELLRRHVDATRHTTDHGLQREQVLLPLDEPGRVTILFSPGPESDVASDWVWLKSVRGIGAPVALFYRGLHSSAMRVATPHGMSQMQDGPLEVTMVHAPSEIEFDLQPGMHRLKGTYGLLPSAWNGPRGSAGATFEIWHLPPQGAGRRLFQVRLNPVHIPADRGPRAFDVELPKPAEGIIRLVTLPTHPQDNSFNHTYWASLTAEEFQASIATPRLPLPHEQITAPNGYNELTQDGQIVTYAHAPSEIVFPRPAALRRLTGSCGLLASAYSEKEATEGARFSIEGEYPDGRRAELWSRELDPQTRAADRGFIPFSVVVPDGAVRLIFRADARPGHGFNRAWTFWHDLNLAP